MSQSNSFRASLAFQLAIAARNQDRLLDEALQDTGLTRLGWFVLSCIGEDRLGQPSAIAGALQVDRAAISRSLKRLEDRGFAERRAGDQDRRTANVVITEPGALALARASEAVAAAMLRMTWTLGSDRRLDFLRILQQVNQTADATETGLRGI